MVLQSDVDLAHRSSSVHVHSHRHHQHFHSDPTEGHAHTHGVIDPQIAASDRGLWAVKWSFIGLITTAVLQIGIVALSGSVALLADTFHNFADAATARAFCEEMRGRSVPCMVIGS